MARICLIIISLFSSTLTWAQLYQSTIPYKTVKNQAKGGDTLNLPFIDDFSSYTGSPTNDYWLAGGGGYVNNSYAVFPPSYNALTLDGTDNNGQPYNFVSGATENVSIDIDGETDYIISKPIDLSIYGTLDGIAFSFYWQKGSFSANTIPELKDGDTLKLFFKSKSGAWKKVFPIDSNKRKQMDTLINGHDFVYEFLSIKDTNYLHDAFQFKFTTHGKVTGAWDVWNIDYVYLDKGRLTDNIQDFAFSSVSQSLFADYHSIPVEALLQSNFTLSDGINAKTFNLTNIGNFIGQTNLDITANGLLMSQSTATGDFLPAQSNKEVNLSIDKITFNNNIGGIPNPNEITFISKLSLVTPDDSLSTNDTLSFTNTLKDYYAYDDGSAEMAIGFGEYGELVMEYEFSGSDTITAIDINFLKIGHNLENTPISIRLWESIEGVNGANSSVRLASIFTGVRYKTGLNQFTRYNLDKGIILSPGKYYIGYESASLNPTYIGFDKNTDLIQQKVYMRRSGEVWSQDETILLAGTPMIRPVFGDVTGLKNTKEEEKEQIKTTLNVKVYPNPTANKLHIEKGVKTIILSDITGRKVIEQTNLDIESKTILELGFLNKGTYYLYLSDGRLEEVQMIVVSQ